MKSDYKVAGFFAPILNVRNGLSAQLAIIFGLALSLTVCIIQTPYEIVMPQNVPLDTPTHLNILGKLIDTGDFLHLAPAGGYYPPLLHILALPFALIMNSIPAGLYTSWIIFTGIIFPAGMLFLTKTLLEKVGSFSKTAMFTMYIITPSLAISFLAFPLALTEQTRWAFGAGVAILPYALAFTIRLLRELGETSGEKGLFTRKVRRNLLALGICGILLILTQPRTGFLYAIFIIPYFIIWVIGLRKINRKRAKTISFAGLGVFLAMVIAVVCYVFSKLNGKALNPDEWFSSHLVDSDPLSNVISYVLLGSPYSPFITVIMVILVAIVLFALVHLGKRSKLNEVLFLPFAWILGFVSFVACSMPYGLANIISALWYREAERVGIVAVVCIVPLLIYVFQMVIDYLKSPLSTIIIVLLAISSLTLAFSATNSPSYQKVLSFATLSSQDNGEFFNQPRLEFLQKVGENTPENALIMADPYDGSIYARALISRKTLLTGFNNSMDKQPQKWELFHNLERAEYTTFQTNACAFSSNFYILDLGEYQQSNALSEAYLYASIHNPQVIDALLFAGIATPTLSTDTYALYKVNC